MATDKKKPEVTPVDVVKSLQEVGVENRMFFGMRDIKEGIFQNKLSEKRLRAWVHYLDFPAPFLPGGIQGNRKIGVGNLRVTTWGLVEAWLLMMYNEYYQTGFDALADDMRSLKPRLIAARIIKKLYGDKDVPLVIHQIEAQGRRLYEERIRREAKAFEDVLRKEVYLKRSESQNKERRKRIKDTYRTERKSSTQAIKRLR